MKVQKNTTKVPFSEKYILWIPRALTFIFLVFLTLPAFFLRGETLSETLKMILFDLFPFLVFWATYFLSWKRPLWGGYLFIFWGILSLFLLPSYRDFSLFMGFTIPLISSGALFILQKKIQEDA